MSQSKKSAGGPAETAGVENGRPAHRDRLGLSAEELLTTTRSVRRRLDFDRPVDRSTVMRCLDWALQAPNGSNRQGWTWVFVDDADVKRAVADVYWRNFEHLIATAYADASPAQAASIDSGRHLATHLERCPVLLVPFIDGRLDRADVHVAASRWGSIIPAVWSLMLALREHGIGSAWTTVHLGWGGERDVADVLGAPFDEVTQVGLFPIAYTIGTDFRRAARRPPMEVARWNSWGNPVLDTESEID